MNRAAFVREMRELRDKREIEDLTDQEIDAVAIKIRPETLPIGTVISTGIPLRWHINLFFTGRDVLPCDGRTIHRKDHPRFFAYVDKAAGFNIGDFYVIRDMRPQATTH